MSTPTWFPSIRPQRLLRGVLAALTAILLAGVAVPTAAASLPERDGAALSADAASAFTTASAFTLVQMNLCLSGKAGCYARTEYPAVLDEAEARIRLEAADAVTVNEACSQDIADLAARLGYDFRFTTVNYGGAPLACTQPTGRGFFGNAVLTKAAIADSQDGVFTVFTGTEQRRWLCVTAQTAEGVDVCTSHLSVDPTSWPALTASLPSLPEFSGSAAASSSSGSAESGSSGVNATQCRELAGLLAGRGRSTIFAGDVNRYLPCAPQGWWALTDLVATQAHGIQHVYGNLDSPTMSLHPARYADHDFVVVRAQVTPPADPR